MWRSFVRRLVFPQLFYGVVCMQVNSLLMLNGIQGSGKGEHGKWMRQIFSIHVLPTSTILSEAVRTRQDVKDQVESAQRAGLLVPASVVSDVVKRHITRLDKGMRHGIDGFPRSVDQAIPVFKMLRTMNTSIDFLILELPEVVARQRLLAAAASRADRPDGSEEAINARLRAFHEETVPTFAWVEEQAKLFPSMIRVHRVDSNQPFPTVAMRIQAALRLPKTAVVDPTPASLLQQAPA